MDDLGFSLLRQFIQHQCLTLFSIINNIWICASIDVEVRGLSSSSIINDCYLPSEKEITFIGRP